MLPQALAIYRRHFALVVLTCALSLVPANLLTAGAVVFGLATLNTEGVAEARTPSQDKPEKTRYLQEKSPAAGEREERVRQLGRAAVQGDSTFDAEVLRKALPVAYAVLIAVLLLLAGLLLSLAALVPLVRDLQAGTPTGSAHAWAVVGSRFGALAWTALLAVPLVAVGAVLCVLPGIAVAVGFAFAVPVAMSESVSGRAALERSWMLVRRHWVPVLGVWALIALFTLLASGVSMLAPPGLWRPVVSGAVRLIAYPLPLLALVLQYERAVR